MKIIGRCTIDKNLIKSVMPELVCKEHSESSNEFWRYIYALKEKNIEVKENFELFNTAYCNSFKYSHTGLVYSKTSKEKEKIYKENFLSKFNEWCADIEESQFILKCVYYDDKIAVVIVSEQNTTAWMFPSKCVKVSEYKCYNSLNGSELLSLVNGVSDKQDTLAIHTSEKSKQEIVQDKTVLKEMKQALETEINDVENARKGELADLQAEIDKITKKLEEKKANMLNTLEIKKKELEAKIEQVNDTIFFLDSQIYNIRCYTGEIVELKQLRKGLAAKDNTPIVFYQKIRYLDEELGKIASIYNVDFDNAKHFETLLKTRTDVLDTFAPSQRSLMLVRVTKDNKGYKRQSLNTNILETYEKYHGNKIAIILRDGDNLYIAWTDDERIYFSENAFYRPGESEISESEKNLYKQGDYESDKEYSKRLKELNKENLKESLGRYYVYSIMQGIMDRKLVVFPEHVSFFKNSQYIIKSYAEGWITTNQYGTFEDMIKKCNSSIKKGDYIITVQSLYPENWTRGYQTYINVRGRGEKNRTHDVSAEDCTLYPINYVEHYATYEYMYNDCIDKSEWNDEEVKDYTKRWNISDVKKIPNTDNYKYYISLVKSCSYFSNARANFQVYEEEFINLTFMNSVWLEYVITNQKTSNIHIGGKRVDFTYLLPYLKKALEHVRKRETKVAEYIKNIEENVLEDTEWPVKLTEWMIENDIHNFSEFRTKQFIKHIKN